jgi:hypothetical protein
VASSASAPCVAPADCGELFELYGDDIRRMVWKQLGFRATPQDVEDGVAHVLVAFVRNKVTEQYDGQKISDFTHEPVKFKAFIMHKVELYCRDLRSRQQRQRREPLLVDTPLPSEGDAHWTDLLGGVTDDYPSLESGDVLERLRAGLARRSPRPGEVALLPLFDALTARFREGESVNATAVRGALGMNRAEASARFAELREALRQITDPARFDVGGMVLSAEQVRAAVDALKAAPGNRVLPAFANAGHPLAGAGKTWYLGFAAEVMRQYPETRVPRGGHYPGGHFGKVKSALVYGLEKMLHEAGELPQVQPPTWRNMELLLARMPGGNPDRVAMVMELARLVFAAEVPA